MNDSEGYMKAKIAVATVSGKAYFLIVNELKKKSVPFLSLTPNDPIPIEVKVVLTTEDEKPLISHEKILIYEDKEEPEAFVNRALRIIYGKRFYEKIVIGIDPGKVFGLAVIADGKVIETGNFFSVEEILNKLKSALKSFNNSSTTLFSVKIGNGVQTYKDKLLEALDEALPSDVVLEIVNEVGTNRIFNETKHRRGLRDIASAIRIGGRNGNKFPRRKVNNSER